MKTAMIFAAGRGERLRPLTDTCPKALCNVRGMPLIEYHISRLAKTGFQNIIINHAHLGGEIRHYLGNGSRFNVNIVYSPEPPGALETGGAMVNARQFLGNEPFVTVNADIFTDYDFSQLSLPNNQLAHLVLVRQPPFYAHADFGLSEAGLLMNHDRQFTFSGIACYRPQLFDTFKPGRFSLTPFIRKLTEDALVSANVYYGYWIDIGSAERLSEANSMDRSGLRKIDYRLK